MPLSSFTSVYTVIANMFIQCVNRPRNALRPQLPVAISAPTPRTADFLRLKKLVKDISKIRWTKLDGTDVLKGHIRLLEKSSNEKHDRESLTFNRQARTPLSRLKNSELITASLTHSHTMDSLGSA